MSSHSTVDTGMPMLSATEKQALESSLSIPLRPNVGVSGKGINLFANYLQVSNLPVGDIIHYDVNVNPEVPRNLRRSLFAELEVKYRKSEFSGRLVAYDGMSNMYSLGSLPKDSYNLLVQVPDRKPGTFKDFQFKIKKVSSVNMALLSTFLDGKLDFTPYDVITALEVIMRHPMVQNNVVVGRSIFDGNNVVPISGCVDIWKGFFLSLRPSLGRLLLNLDTSVSSFIAEGPVIPMLKELFGIPKTDPFQTLPAKIKISAEHWIRTTRVEVTHRGECKRKFKVIGFGPSPADQTFENEAGEKQSVVQYFKTKYNLELRFPNLPCIAVGSPQRAVYLPMEVCKIPKGQRYMKKLDGVQTSDMIKVANVRPTDRMNNIRAGTKLIKDSSEYLNAFQLGFGDDLLKIKGRVLPPPTLYYGQNCRDSETVPIQGAWNLKDKTVERGSTLSSWAVVCFARMQQSEVQEFVQELASTCQMTGMTIEMKQPPIMMGTNDVKASIRNAYAKAESVSGKKAQIILCILPTDEAALYGEIKCCTDTEIGLPSQCMLMKHAKRPSKQYCANLCLKINVKLGGVNSSLGKQLKFIVERPTMVFGADVTHPGIGEIGKPSVAAVVGSMDIQLSRYAASIRVQGSRVEIIADMKNLFKEQIKHFVASNRVKPHRILFYRDGVSEGQFAQVLKFELSAMKEACKEIEPSYDPKITFILVQKRHHTRFFAANSSDTDRSGNVPAGTVVDTGCVHPNQFDFYLMSHGGIQGTSRPAHYHVVHDENSFTADDLQNLSYQMCYTFARCTRSVSIVTAAYYAHLVAFRARFHLAGSPRNEFIKVKEELAPNMYFI